MKKLNSLRKVAVVLMSFTLGLLMSGTFPVWAYVVIPPVWMLWFMAYDEARYQYEMRRKRRDKI